MFSPSHCASVDLWLGGHPAEYEKTPDAIDVRLNFSLYLFINSRHGSFGSLPCEMDFKEIFHMSLIIGAHAVSSILEFIFYPLNRATAVAYGKVFAL